MDKLIVIYTDCKESMENLAKMLQSLGIRKAHFVTKNPLIKGEAIRFLHPVEYEQFVKDHKRYLEQITKEFCKIRNTDWEYVSIENGNNRLERLIKGKMYFQADFLKEVSKKKGCYYLNGILHKIDWLALKIAGRTVFHEGENKNTNNEKENN